MAPEDVQKVMATGELVLKFGVPAVLKLVTELGNNPNPNKDQPHLYIPHLLFLQVRFYLILFSYFFALAKLGCRRLGSGIKQFETAASFLYRQISQLLLAKLLIMTPNLNTL